MKTAINNESFRLARNSDDLNIHSAVLQVWPDDCGGVQQIRKALEDPRHAAFISFLDGRVTGFVDSFITTTAAGEKRWEIDLLGVVPDQRGRHIGTQLVQASMKRALSFRPGFARAFVQVENHVSRKVFSSLGFVESSSEYRLYSTRNPLGHPVDKPAGVEFIPVQTFSYSGIWLEGNLTLDAFLAGRAVVNEGDGLAGAVIDADNGTACQAAVDAGYNFVDTYRWWIYSWNKSGLERCENDFGGGCK